MGEMVRVRTVTLLLLMLWGVCFAFGAYQIYIAWTEHRGPHGKDGAQPLGLPEIAPHLPVTNRLHIRLGT
jgi:hypothetical protein